MAKLVSGFFTMDLENWVGNLKIFFIAIFSSNFDFCDFFEKKVLRPFTRVQGMVLLPRKKSPLFWGTCRSHCSWVWKSINSNKFSVLTTLTMWYHFLPTMKQVMVHLIPIVSCWMMLFFQVFQHASLHVIHNINCVLVWQISISVLS